MRCANHHDVSDRRILPEGFIAEDSSFNFFGADTVSRHVDHIVRPTMQSEGPFVSSAGVVALRVGQFAIPSAEVNLGKTLNIPLPGRGAQRLAMPPKRARQIRVRLRDNKFAFFA